MSILKNSTILITGADGGIGNALLNECIKRGASKIYATALSTDKLQLFADLYPQTIVPIKLDVTDQNSVEKISVQCNDVNILINNAGIELKSSFIGEDAVKNALLEMKVNYIGALSLINSFLPTLKRHHKSYIVNVLSVGSTAVVKRLGTYCASKSAGHILTQTIREELKESNIKVIGVYPGYVNTQMSSDLMREMPEPNEIATNICSSIENGDLDIFPDKMSSDFYSLNPINIVYIE